MSKRRTAKLQIYRRLERDLWGFFTYKYLIKYFIKIFITSDYFHITDLDYIYFPKKARLILDTLRERSFIFRTLNRSLRVDVGKPGRTRKLVLKTPYARRFFRTMCLKKYYGEVTKRQFKKVALHAFKTSCGRHVVTKFLFLLESRIDILLFRLVSLPSIYEIRQLINHKGVLVNFRKITYINCSIKLFDIFGFGERRSYFLKRLLFAVMNNLYFYLPPAYMEVNYRLLLCTFWTPKVRAEDIPYYGVKIYNRRRLYAALKLIRFFRLRLGLLPAQADWLRVRTLKSLSGAELSSVRHLTVRSLLYKVVKWLRVSERVSNRYYLFRFNFLDPISVFFFMVKRY